MPCAWQPRWCPASRRSGIGVINTSERHSHHAWTIKIRGILPASDRTFKKLEGTETETVTEDDDRSWFLSRSSHVAPLQMRANGDLEPVQVTVTTTWNLGLEP